MSATTFATSGSTGQPTVWTRTPDQLRAEATLIGDHMVGEVDEVVCHAPPHHLFGQLFGSVLPELRGIPVQWLHDDPLQAPQLRDGSRVLFVCLPSTWVLLRRLGPRLAALDRAVLLHGAGPTTPVTDDVMTRLAGSSVRATELFGSTETGAIGSRDIAPAWSRAPWTLLPDVSVVADPVGADSVPAEHRPSDGTQRLRVHSPRLARPADADEPPFSLRTDDVVRMLDERHFEYLGRVTRLLKVNGRRCNLDHLEQLMQVLLRRPVACAPVRDRIRGEHYELFYEAGTGAGTIDAAEVWRRLASLADTVPVPRSVHAVTRIPRTPVGKVKIDQLYAETAVSTAQAR